MISWSVTNQTKATEQYHDFFGTVYYAVQGGSNFGVCACMTIQMKATEQYLPVVLFIMLYKVVLTFASVDEILEWSFK